MTIIFINQRGLREVRWLDFPSYIDAATQLADPFAIDIEADHRRAAAGKSDRHRQPDITKADDGDLASMHGHAGIPNSELWTRAYLICRLMV